MGDNMSPADVAAVVGNTDRNYGYPYPVYTGMGNSGFGNGYGSDWIWIILLLALFGGFNGNGNGGFGGGFNNDYAWLSNGQKEIIELKKQIQEMKGMITNANEFHNADVDEQITETKSTRIQGNKRSNAK